MNEIQNCWINIYLNLFELFIWLYLEETHINITSLIYKKPHIDTTLNIYIYTHIYIYIYNIYIYIYIYIYIPTYKTSRIYILEYHIQILQHIYCIIFIYWRSTHRYYNVNRSYINIQRNKRLEFNYLFTALSEINK